ncbi:MAG: thiamine pyrophosphate-dependent dehydrogenase E1 component subunit alpha [Spirochaetaceae bacterium]|nr:MAG: thiamine pyrophosphate-dependent dehydrogenase E1 component subunit alpha [Spirochaetaceae bacterium]
MTKEKRAGKPDLSVDKLQDMYIKMLYTRKFEEKVAYFFSRGMVHGTTHLCIGQEASAIGAIAALEEGDWMAATHRGHGHTIGKGLDLKPMMAELLGKSTGFCRGKGGSMHIADITKGHLGANGIVGGGIPIATGAGLSVKLRGEEKAVLCFFGDGAINQGTFHESLNMASVWNLPVIYLCENNQYGMSMSQKRATNVDDLSLRAHSYGIPGVRIDGNDIFTVYETVKTAREHVLKQGPYLIIAETYRFMGHSKSDANKYRTKDEINQWKEKDPIPRMRRYLEERKIFSAAELDAIEQKATADIEEAVEYARTSPDPVPEDLINDVYAG